ncbi:MAG: hypothetical protein AAF065_13650 [Verrucomicrobiota bacterium]
MENTLSRPRTAAELVIESANMDDFRLRLIDWQEELTEVSSRKEFAKRIAEPPILLAEQNGDHGQCDAYLAAYVEWLCELHRISVPDWVQEAERVARKTTPSFWGELHGEVPKAFARRAVSATPKNSLKLRRGRPRVSAEQKRKKGVERQRRYRARIRAKLAKLKLLEGNFLATD